MSDMRDQESDDEDLKRAIALSLQAVESSATHPASTIPVRSGKPQATNAGAEEGEDEDLKRAIANSLQDDGVPKGYSSSKSTKAANVSTGMLNIDRKAMEAERLARLERKRKAEDDESISPPTTKRDMKQKAAPISVSQPIAVQSSSQSNPQRPVYHPTSTSAGLLTPQYPFGVVKLTHSTSHPRSPDDETVTLSEVLQPANLKLAVLSAFQWDIGWLVPKINQRQTKLILVMQAKDEATQRAWRADIADAVSIRLCFPPMPGTVNCMHSKLMLLGYGNVLRVVVPSANLTAYDWGETGVMENSVFMIDLPHRQDGVRGTEDDLGMFGRELVRFCRAKTLDENVVDQLYEFDWTGAEGLAFVHSIGGEHTGDLDGEDAAWMRTGYTGLGRAVRTLGLRVQAGQKVEVDFVASSVGSLNDDFLSSLYLACSGDSGVRELNWRTNATNIVQHAEQKTKGLAKARSKVPDADMSGRLELVATAKQNFRLFFPSRMTVEESLGGTKSAGTISFQRKWYEGPKFPKEIMRDCKSKRQGLLMHNKASNMIELNKQPPKVPGARSQETSPCVIDAKPLPPD